MFFFSNKILRCAFNKAKRSFNSAKDTCGFSRALKFSSSFLALMGFKQRKNKKAEIATNAKANVSNTEQTQRRPTFFSKKISARRVIWRGLRPVLFGVVAVIVFTIFRPRAVIPPHLAGHPVLNVDGLIPTEAGKQLNELIREMQDFPSNLNADLKSGFSGAREDIGEGQPIGFDGTCSHPFLVPNLNKTLCVLPQRIDVGRHFVLTGGPDGVRESYEKLIARALSFGRYMTDLSNYPVVENLFGSDGFQNAAKQVCPVEKPYLDPFQFNFIIQVPGQTVALHLDAPYFWGATRKNIPQWLLVVMVFSGLFTDRFIDQVQVVGYLHEWSTEGVGGDFIYYNGRTSELLSPKPLAGNSVDGSKTIHAALIYHPEVAAPAITKDDEASLKYIGNETWNIVVNGAVLRQYASKDLRISIVYRARCFGSSEEAARFRAPQDLLSVEEVLDALTKDMLAKNKVTETRLEKLDRVELGILMMETYIKYPFPSLSQAIIPYNYCALGRLSPWAKPFLSLIC